MAKTNKRMGGMELLNKALGIKKGAENKLFSFGASLRSMPTSAGKGKYKSLTVGETADKLKRTAKKLMK